MDSCAHAFRRPITFPRAKLFAELAAELAAGLAAGLAVGVASRLA